MRSLTRVAWAFALSLATGAVGSSSAADLTPRQLLEDGHYRRARAAAESRVATAPGDAEALCVVSQLKLLSGDRETALQLAERSVKADSKNPLTHLQLAKVLVEAVNHAGGLARGIRCAGNDGVPVGAHGDDGRLLSRETNLASHAGLSIQLE